jgi:myo-inositol-1-phosphate synthase
MNNGRFGIWLIGAWGRIGTATAAGLAALQGRFFDAAGLVSDLPQFARLDLVDWECFVLGGHEIRRTSYRVEARSLLTSSPLFAAERLEKTAFTLDAFDKNVRTGTLINVGAAIESLATPATRKTRGERPRTAIERIMIDLREFRVSQTLEHVIVVNLASTEAPATPEAIGLTWPELARVLDQAERSPLPASTLYAAAAMQAGCSYINFTASLGSDLPAFGELAAATGTLHMGRDGETNETPLTDLRAPLWRDCDSVRGAASVLDLARFAEREHRRGNSGLMTFLSPFFKCPMGTETDEFRGRLARLESWADDVSRE